MRTRVVRVDEKDTASPHLAEAGRIVREGGLVGFPTETVYGIALDLRDEEAVRRLYRVKGRPDHKPITVHLPDAEALRDHLREMPRAAWKLARTFWPGPLTLVLDDRHGRPTGFRVPDHAACRAFLRHAACVVGGTSANLSGDEPATDAKTVAETFDGLLDLVIDGGPCRHQVASTVVRVTDRVRSGAPEILREGAIPPEEIADAAAKSLLFVCSGNTCRSPLAAAFARDLLARRFQCGSEELASHGYRVASAGTSARRGETASAAAHAAARAWNCDLTAHRARNVTPSLVEDADDIFVMTAEQRASILAFTPEAATRVRLLDPAGKDIPDPHGEGDDAYRAAAERIHRVIEQRLDDF
ncbi:MAG: Threonylcarbamoyl-AMP synthase [Planctomycetes bacterium]|nr:Threonylcarbamoyl-AMP synthase [Planctomycetota bacterium]